MKKMYIIKTLVENNHSFYFIFASVCVRCYTENKANDCFVDTKESFSIVRADRYLGSRLNHKIVVYSLLSRKILLLNSKHFN